MTNTPSTVKPECIHSWFRQPDRTFKCIHCGKHHDHVAEQADVMDRFLVALRRASTTPNQP